MALVACLCTVSCQCGTLSAFSSGLCCGLDSLLHQQATGLDEKLQAPSDPAYTGPVLPEQQYHVDLPWWFAGAQGAAAAAPPPPPPPAPVAPPAAGVPAAGPYTVSILLEQGLGRGGGGVEAGYCQYPVWCCTLHCLI